MPSPQDTFWKSKLAAFLHDPPHKPFRIAGHEDARESFWREVHLSKDDFLSLIHRPDDHLAAAADRMIFPAPKAAGVRTDWKADADCAFHHPLGGGKLIPSEFPRTAEAAEAMIMRSLQSVGLVEEMPAATAWWRLWREWPEFSAREHAHFAYLVADTRIPHHTLWHHNGLVSALSTCDKGCSFLLFQIGPVQDFIKQARSTRDLWAGSYLLSYLIAKALFAVAKAVGPESIVYPQLRGVPLIDWFGHCADGQLWTEEKRASLKDKHGVREELLTPNLPNRFLALVPKDWRDDAGNSIATVAENAVRVAWGEIVNSVHQAIQDQVGKDFADWDAFWQTQTDRFPTVDFVIHDWQETKVVLAQAEAGTPPLHDGWDQHPLKQAIEWATEKIPFEHLDSRCYKHKSWKEGLSWKNLILNASGKALEAGEKPVIANPGFVWALHYAATEWQFAAVKNARGYNSWGAPQGVEKDHLDGRNEVLGGPQHDAFWEAMRMVKWDAKVPKLFKGHQEYGALTTIKRLFPYVWMQQALDTRVPAFDSVIDIALEDDASESNTYYAILAMDGDDMGKWVSGTKTPPWKDVLSGHADDPKTPLGYFAKQWGEGWEKVRVPLTPSFHAALSEALGNFSLYCARQIVDAFGGQLIYAGGDDVLAMLPAPQAVDCAIALRFVFRGLDPAQNGASLLVQDKIAELFDFPASGFIRCKQGTGKGDHCRPNWPLMVMGPKSTASVGIAIGHVRSPMQDVVQAARDAEHAAKAVPEKGVLALRILKRSGESVEFSTRFDSGVLGVWGDLAYHSDQLSGRFIYRFLQKLRPVLAKVVDGRAGWEPAWENDGIDLLPIAEAELTQAIIGQSELHKDQGKERPAYCRQHAESWMRQLGCLDPKNFLHFWMARAFLNRLDSTGKETDS